MRTTAWLAVPLLLCVGCWPGDGEEGAAACPNHPRYDTGSIHNWAPDWSPDGEQLAFASSRGGTGDGVYVVDIETCAVKPLDPGSEPAWSPRGEQLAVEREIRESGPTRIYVVNVASGESRLLARNEHPRSRDHWPDWSATGRIAFVRLIWRNPGAAGYSEHQLVTVRPDGTGLRIFARETLRRPALAGDGWTSPAWSPDGRQLAWGCGEGAICVASADGTERRVAIRSSGAVRHVAWAPDGGSISFVVEDPGSQLRSFRAPAAGGEPTRLLTTVGEAVDAAWSPDGKRLAFAQFLENSSYSDLFVVRPDGSELRRLTAAPGDRE
jgi:Tol biopolymer transport system component